MKYYIFLFLLLIFSTSCLNTKNIVTKESSYVIKKIKEEKSYYLIYTQRNDSIFKIISEKDTFLSNCKKIKEKRIYDLDLIKTHPLDSIFGLPISYSLGIKGIEMPDESIVEFEKKSHYTLYHAENLKGLCIIEE